MPHKVALALTVLIVLFSLSCGGGSAAPDAAAPVATTPPAQAPGSLIPGSAPGSASDVVKVENQDKGGSGEYMFVPSEFNFKVGQTVTFEVSAETEFHTFTVDELGIDWELDAGETKTFTHTFDRAGSFELVCIPHQVFGMTGVIVVE